ncbi:hypothetical protein ACH4PX_06485 [Streptomyces anulatus]
MSRMAQVIVLARYEDEVMEPLTRPDEARTWPGCFVQIPWFVGGWHIEFERRNGRRGVLKDLESLPWNDPACVQVMLHDEDDDPAPGGCTPQPGRGTRTPASWSRPAWAEERTGTRQSTYKTHGRAGDPVQAGAGQMLKSPLPVLPVAGPVSSAPNMIGRTSPSWPEPRRRLDR